MLSTVKLWQRCNIFNYKNFEWTEQEDSTTQPWLALEWLSLRISRSHTENFEPLIHIPGHILAAKERVEISAMLFIRCFRLAVLIVLRPSQPSCGASGTLKYQFSLNMLKSLFG